MSRHRAQPRAQIAASVTLPTRPLLPGAVPPAAPWAVVVVVIVLVTGWSPTEVAQVLALLLPVVCAANWTMARS